MFYLYCGLPASRQAADRILPGAGNVKRYEIDKARSFSDFYINIMNTCLQDKKLGKMPVDAMMILGMLIYPY
jgi:hypothetical protein